MMIDRTSELLDDPKWFYCRRTRCKLKIDICVGRQKANKQRTGFDALPFGICEGCGQGAENMALQKPMKVIQKNPRRGRGKRDESCASYSECLDLATKKEWQTFNCESCQMALESWGVTMEEAEKKVNTRVCGDCKERTTIHPNSPYCARCMAERGKRKREAQAETASEEKSPANGKGRGRPRTRSQGLISKPGSGEKVSTDQKAVVTVDFAGHPAILEEVGRLAREDIRPVELQILYMLKKQISGKVE